MADPSNIIKYLVDRYKETNDERYSLAATKIVAIYDRMASNTHRTHEIEGEAAEPEDEEC